jgi:hypothetical protein
MTSDAAIREIIKQYQRSFNNKTHIEINSDYDVIMDLFSITPSIKRQNMQYWGRELGMCWQHIVSTICKEMRPDYKPAQKFGEDEPFDLSVGKYAIDTKYRIGSGDSGTLKKFRDYGQLLKREGFEPIVLIVRPDNLPAAITACQYCFKFLRELTGFDLYNSLNSMRGQFPISISRSVYPDQYNSLNSMRGQFSINGK